MYLCVLQLLFKIPYIGQLICLKLPGHAHSILMSIISCPWPEVQRWHRGLQRLSHLRVFAFGSCRRGLFLSIYWRLGVMLFVNFQLFYYWVRKKWFAVADTRTGRHWAERTALRGTVWVPLLFLKRVCTEFGVHKLFFCYWFDFSWDNLVIWSIFSDLCSIRILSISIRWKWNRSKKVLHPNLWLGIPTKLNS